MKWFYPAANFSVIYFKILEHKNNHISTGYIEIIVAYKKYGGLLNYTEDVGSLSEVNNSGT